MSLKETIIQRLAEAGGRIRVRSALNPALWLCVFVTIPTAIIASHLTTPTPIWLILIAMAPVAVATFGFLFLLFFDRDKLQSEDYQIRMKSLELIQEKGQAFPISATSLEAITNPTQPQLPNAEPRDEV